MCTRLTIIIRDVWGRVLFRTNNMVPTHINVHTIPIIRIPLYTLQIFQYRMATRRVVKENK